MTMTTAPLSPFESVTNPAALAARLALIQLTRARSYTVNLPDYAPRLAYAESVRVKALATFLEQDAIQNNSRIAAELARLSSTNLPTTPEELYRRYAANNNKATIPPPMAIQGNALFFLGVGTDGVGPDGVDAGAGVAGLDGTGGVHTGCSAGGGPGATGVVTGGI